MNFKDLFSIFKKPLVKKNVVKIENSNLSFLNVNFVEKNAGLEFMGKQENGLQVGNAEKIVLNNQKKTLVNPDVDRRNYINILKESLKSVENTKKEENSSKKTCHINDDRRKNVDKFKALLKPTQKDIVDITPNVIMNEKQRLLVNQLKNSLKSVENVKNETEGVESSVKNLKKLSFEDLKNLNSLEIEYQNDDILYRCIKLVIFYIGK
ncbi:hypothetical protein HK099_001475 [Clydaea vesicula]|uniref:Uncharacterized protein n=1 Tax=Clydaea vesicula TaxID=447962 RepID=A0AAD5XSC7_9FUNG|nr:hypothetical protein HK099_001475 [Clydaea vesicula]